MDRYTTPRREILDVVQDLTRFGKHDFKSLGYITIERVKLNWALSSYKSSLMDMTGFVEAETPSATMVSSAQLEWSAEKAEVGMTIRQRHIGIIRPQVRPLVDKWVKAGSPYPSSGGIYYSIPNKSYKKVRDLATVPELRDAVLNLGLEDEWLRFWESYLPLRHNVSRELLNMVISRVDTEALSRHNEEAGTGLQIRGMRLKRKDLHHFARDLEFLLPYSYSLGIAFAAVQLAPLPPDHVWLIDVYDSRIKGAVASRSDIDVKDVNWDGERLTIEGTSQTRQAGSDASGALSNSSTERRMLSSSVTEKVVRDFRRRGVEYPFTNKRLLMDIWATDAKPFPGKKYVIGQDFGLMSPVPSPADALFSRGFIRLSNKVIPLMLSGSSWTQAVYSVFHNHFIQRCSADDQLLCLGDDMNLLTAYTSDDVFHPYIKVKSTDPASNTKKILGSFSSFSPHPDPTGSQPALIGIVPRVIKTLSSASKRGSRWGETLSKLETSGKMNLTHDPKTDEEIERDMPILLRYMQWSGKRSDLSQHLQSLWGHIPPDIWEILTRYDEEIEYRLRPQEDEA